MQQLLRSSLRRARAADRGHQASLSRNQAGKQPRAPGRPGPCGARVTPLARFDPDPCSLVIGFRSNPGALTRCDHGLTRCRRRQLSGTD
jgi:hypothetical protein